MTSMYLNKRSAAIFAKLIAGLDVGQARTIDTGSGFMAVHVERLYANRYSLTHAVLDPDMEFEVAAPGIVAPRFYIGAAHEGGMVAFANQWLANIAQQQDLRHITAIAKAI